MVTKEQRMNNAAAPDLLEALENILAIVEDSSGITGYHLNGEISEWDEHPEIAAAYLAVEKARRTDKDHPTQDLPQNKGHTQKE